MVTKKKGEPPIPLPGRSVPGSKSGRPIMAALNLLSRRWVLRIIWELRDGPCGFNDLRKKCEEMSPDTLSTRLFELQEAGIAASDEFGEWQLTPLGARLKPSLASLVKWSDEWEESLK